MYNPRTFVKLRFEKPSLSNLGGIYGYEFTIVKTVLL